MADAAVSANHVVRPQLGKFIVSLVSPQMARVYRQTMAALGVANNRLIFADTEPLFCQILIYPLPLTQPPATLSCAQQAFVFSRAQCVVGTIGAELANIVFAEDGLRLFVLAPYAR